MTTKHYDWALLNNRDIRDKYALELRNRFETLQEKTEKGTSNDEYENFVEAHLEAASKCIPTKPRTKYRVPWETLAVREKRALVKTAFKGYRKNPTNTNARKLEKAQYQLAGIYLKEQTEYIQNQIDKIRDSVEDRQCIPTVILKQLQLGRSFILSVRPDFYMMNKLSVPIHAFIRYMLISVSVDEILLPRYIDCFTNFVVLPLKVEIFLLVLKS